MEDDDFDDFKEATQLNEDSANLKMEIMLPNKTEIKDENENLNEKLEVTEEKLNEIRAKEQHFSAKFNEKENEFEKNIEEVTENKNISEKAKEEIFNDSNEKINEVSKNIFKENINEDFTDYDNNLATNEVLATKEIKENNFPIINYENGDQKEVKLETNFQINNDNLHEKPLENIILQQYINFEEKFSQAKIENDLTYSEKKVDHSNENEIIFDITKVNNQSENEKNDIKEILKAEACIQNENQNFKEANQNIISRSNEHIIIIPETIPEVIKQNETIFETKEEPSKVDFFGDINEKLENQKPNVHLFDQNEEMKDLPISSNRNKEIDRKEQNRSIPENDSLQLIPLDIRKDELLPIEEGSKLAAEYDENKEKEKLLEEQKEYSLDEEKNINMDRSIDKEGKEREKNNIVGDFEENQIKYSDHLQSSKEQIEFDKEKDETILKVLPNAQNLLMDDKNRKEIVQNLRNEDDNNDNDDFGAFEEHCSINEKNLFDTENLIQNNPNDQKEYEPKIIEQNLTISENEQNSNQNPNSNNNEIKNENEDSFGNFEENNFCNPEAKSDNPNLIESVTRAEVVNFELKDQEIKVNESKLEKECKIQEIDFDEGFDDFQGEQKKMEENDKECEMEKKSIENKEIKDESSSIDFGDFEESNMNQQEIQSLSQNQKEFQNLDEQKKLPEQNKTETINFGPESSNLDFNFQPINNNSSTFEFPLFTSTASLNPNFNFEAIIQAKIPEELNFPEAKRTEIAKDDLDFFDEMDEEKEREEILEESPKKEDYSIFGRKVDDIRKNFDDFKNALFSSSEPKRRELARSAEIKEFKLIGANNNCNHDGMFNNETKEMIYAHLKKRKENFKKELLEYDQKLEFIQNTTQLNSLWQNSIIQKNLQKILEINVADNDLTHIDEVTIHKEKSKKKDEIKNKKNGADGSSSPVFDHNFIDKLNESPKKNMKPVLLSKKEITKEKKEEDVPPEVKEKIKNYLESLPNFDFLFSPGITTTHSTH